MAMVNMNNLISGKDPRWLQLEVCREFQRNKCTRSDTECKFAHPPANLEVQNGKVMACYDSIKGRCNREKPPCKYFHPPQHLKDQLLINGRNHLALKNALLQQMGLTPGQTLVAGQVPTAVATSPYLPGMPQVGSTFNHFFTPGPMMHTIVGPDPAVGSPLGVVPQTIVPQKLPRSDRLETLALPPGPAPGPVGPIELGRKRAREPCDDVLLMDMKSSVGSFYYDSFAFPGMVPYKRPAADKSGVPVYQPGATYQQLMQLQQPFVPVSSKLGLGNAPFVVYTDDQGQLLDTLPVCQDFSRNRTCPRPTCHLVHLDADHVETIDGRVTVCRDAAKGSCFRPFCKFYHIPVALPPAGEIARYWRGS